MAYIFHGTTTAGQVEVVSPGKIYRQARVLSLDGADMVFVRGDGIDPAAPFEDCEVIPAVIGFVIVRLRNDPDGDSEVRILSPNAPVAYSVKFFT